LYHKVFTGLAIPGWASVTSVSAFFGAINSLGIAILGEYVARIYDQVRGRPSYVIARHSHHTTTGKEYESRNQHHNNLVEELVGLETSIHSMIASDLSMMPTSPS
jgi:dolichol-phosphate mannosyltransferase